MAIWYRPSNKDHGFTLVTLASEQKLDLTEKVEVTAHLNQELRNIRCTHYERERSLFSRRVDRYRSYIK